MARKKLQKVFALLLTASMTMSLLSVTAFADEPEEHAHNSVTCAVCGGSGKETVSCETCGGSGSIQQEGSCSECGGEGRYLTWDFDHPCPYCNGAGCDAPNCYSGYELYEVICSACNGTGHPSEKCTACNGTGEVKSADNCAICGGEGTVPCTGTFVGAVTKAATCVDTGVMTYTCGTCKANYEETIPVDENAHQWGEPVAVEGKEPTCGADGTGIRTCELCKKSEEVVMPATGEHTYDEETLTCTVCGAPEPADEITAAAIALLEALPAAENVAAEDQADIEAARAAYDKLTDHQKKFVSQELLTRLTAAEEALATALVTHADALLAAMPEDPASDLAATFAAYSAVSALTSEQKALLTNTTKLAALEAYLETVDLYSYSRTGQDAGAWVTYDTTMIVAAPKGTSTSNLAGFNYVQGTSNLGSISKHLPEGCTMDTVYQMTSALEDAAEALEDDEEITLVIQASLLPSLNSCDLYFVSGSSSRETVSLIEDAELSGGTLAIHLNNQNCENLGYIALTRSMKYTDGSYTTPSAAAHSYAPAAHAASSNGITYDYSLDGKDRVVTVTIPAGYTGDTVSINMEAIREVFGELSIGFVQNGQIVAGGFESEDDKVAMDGKDSIAPGMDLTYRIKIVNLSGKDYTYQADSLWMDTAVLEDYIGYTDETCAYPTFDGTNHAFVVFRVWNKALTALLDSGATLDDETINAALQTKYNNTDGIEVNLPHYYLDYYNFVYNTSAATLEQLPDEAIMDLLNNDAGSAKFPETLPELNNLAYNYFYTHGLQVDQSNMWATGYDTSIGAVMAGRSDSMEDKAADAWDDLDAATETPAVLEFTVTPTFLLGNSYMRYPVACDMGFTLKEVTGGGTDGGGDTEYDPRPDPDPDDDEEEIPDEDTPTTDIPDIDTPTTDLPDEETPTTDIPEEETPLADVPKTGDLSALWLAMTALSGTGLAGVTFLGRKKKEQ